MPVNTRAGIKSVQRGVLTMANTETTKTVTVAAVNTAKTELRYLGTSNNANITSQANANVRLYLNNATTVAAIRTSAAAADTVDVTWEMTEWY